MNYKAVPVTCKAQLLPPWTHLSSGEQHAPAPLWGGLVTQRKQNHSPPAPRDPGSLSHPSDPTSPGREARSGVSARCPPQGARPKVLTPRWRQPLSLPLQEDRGKHRDHEGFAQSQENASWSQGWSSGPLRRSKGVGPGKGKEGRNNPSTAGRDTPAFPVNSREAQQDLAGHFLPSPPGKAKSSLSDGREHDLGLGDRGREGATPCPTQAGLQRARTDTLTFAPFSPFSPTGPGSPKKP